MSYVVSRSRKRRAMREINMVPFIDVMLVLLIIFMVSAPLIPPSAINLPRVGQASQLPEQIIQVIIRTNEERVQLKTQRETLQLSLQQLAQAIRRVQAVQNNTTSVVISADKSVNYESVVKVLDNLQRAGIPRIGLSVQLLN